MAKKDKTKKQKVEKPLNPLLASGILVPLLVGFAISAAATSNLPTAMSVSISTLIGCACAGAYYVFAMDRKNKKIKKGEKAPEIPTKTPDDIVINTLAKYKFVRAYEPEVVERPEAYSLDGLRWSHQLVFETESGESETFIIRGSLVTGDGELEYVNGASQSHPREWAAV